MITKRSPKFSVVMVSYHTGDILFQTIDSVLRQNIPLELIIVDNGNSSTCMAKLDELTSNNDNVMLLSGHGNIGFSKACNLGAQYASAKCLALLNPDCYLDDNALNTCLSETVHLSGNWMVGGNLRNPDNSAQQGTRRAFLTPWLAAVEALQLYRLAPKHPYFKRFNQHESRVPETLTEVQAISGACMVMPTQVFEELGGMDESYFLHVEDLDFCLRHHLKGGKTYFSPSLRGTHHKSSSQVSWFFVEYHKSQSMCLYFEKHFEDFYPAFFMKALKAVIYTKFGAACVAHSVRSVITSISKRIKPLPQTNEAFVTRH